MVLFDILEVSNDAKQLIIEAHVNGAKYFEGYTITDLFINTNEDFLESGVNEEKAIHKTYPNKPTTIKEVINGNFDSKLVFVYVRVEPKANPCTEYLPCKLDCIDTIGVTFDTSLLYNIGLRYIKELGDSCNIPQGFTDFVLHWEGFKLALESEHYIDAVKLFNALFKKKSKVKTSNCGCHGKLFI